MTAAKKRGISTTTAIFMGLLLGGLTGILIHFFLPDGFWKDKVLIDGVFYVLGNGFISAMQMLVVPLVFCSLVTGSMSIGDSKRLGKAGVKTLLFYLATTALAISAALLLASLINPGVGLNIAEVQTGDMPAVSPNPVDFTDTLLNIIPQNPVRALTEGNMLQIIFFALLVGIILARLSDKADVAARFFSQCNDVMMEMTGVVMKFAPIGVFCLIAKTFAGIGFSAFLPMLKYIGTVYLALGVHCFAVYQIILKLFTGLNPLKFVRKFAPVMAFAFSTATSNATVPLSIETLHRRLGVSKRISSFTIPLGATLNMDGTAIMQGVAVIFVAQAYHITLSPAAFLTVIATATVASIGTAGVPGVGLITLSMVFQSVGLPVEGIALIMGIDRIVDMARTAVNITGDAVCTTIVAVQSDAFDRAVFNGD